MNSALAHEQSLLLSALLGGGQTPDLQACLHDAQQTRGLQAYQANGVALAERALSAAYPVVTQMMGAESFGPLAHHFWRQHPPARGDMAEWGSELAEFLEAAKQLADEPFLGDVARIEWALHRAGLAADAEPDMPSFGLLGQSDSATLVLSAGAVVLQSRYPVASLVNAHIGGHPSLGQAAALLQSGAAEFALVWRQGFKPRVRTSSAAEHALVLALKSGLALELALEQALEHALGAALEHAADEPFDFNQWLIQSVQDGLVIAASAGA